MASATHTVPLDTTTLSKEDGSPITPTNEVGKVSEKELAPTEDVAQGTAICESRGKIITPSMKRKAWWQFTALCGSIWVAGWNDGTLGPLLPRLQEVYHVRRLYHRNYARLMVL